jgi:hypothetical protein
MCFLYFQSLMGLKKWRCDILNGTTLLYLHPPNKKIIDKKFYVFSSEKEKLYTKKTKKQKKLAH